MSRNRHKPEQIIAKLREVEVELSKGIPVAAAVKKIAVTEQTYYRWSKGIRRPEGRPGQAAQDAGAGERAIEAIAGRCRTGQGDPEGSRLGTL